MDHETGVTAAARAAVQETETPPTRREFDDRFERCFDRVWAYVSQRTGDRARSERIVDQVLESTLALLERHGDESQQMRLLKAASDRLLGEVNGTRAPIGDARP